MDEAELDKQRQRMVTKSSSIKRKPFANLTNIIRKPNHTSAFSQSKKPGSSNASDSSIGSTQNPIIGPSGQSLPSKPQRLTNDRHVDDDNHILISQRNNSTQNTRSRKRTAVPFYQTSFQETGNKSKQESILSSANLDTIKNQGKPTNDGKNVSVGPHNSSTEKIKDKRKAIDVPLTAHNTKKANNVKINDKGKEIAVKSSNPIVENTNGNMGIIAPDSLIKKIDKGKAIAVDYPPMKNSKKNMVDFCGPLKGVVIRDKEEMVKDSNRVDFAQNDKGKAVVTPVNSRLLEKKDKQSSCPPFLRTTSNRKEGDGAQDIIQFKPKTEPPANKKKRRCSSKEEYTLPQDFVEQQRAYFKEIDDFELQVEEV